MVHLQPSLSVTALACSGRRASLPGRAAKLPALVETGLADTLLVVPRGGMSIKFVPGLELAAVAAEAPLLVKGNILK